MKGYCVRCGVDKEIQFICKDCAAIPPVRSETLLSLLRKVHDEIDALGEGIPMSAETWEEMEDVLNANKSMRLRRLRAADRLHAMVGGAE